MSVLSVSEFEANFDEILERVEAGETFDIARDGKVIAEIGPKRPARDAAWREGNHDDADV